MRLKAPRVGAYPYEEGEEREGTAGLVFVQAGPRHTAAGFGGFHEGVPDEASPEILRHQHGNPGVDSDHIGVVPVGERVECVHKPVLTPSCTVAAPNCF